MNLFSEFFSYTFIIYALIAGSLIALCSSLLGVPLVLKRYSMIGDGLSHVAFGSMAIAMALNASPLMISIPITVLSAFLLLRVSSNSNIKGDSSVALISTSSMALGILITSMTSGLNTDVTSFLFGSILSIGKTDVIISIVLAIFVVGFFVFFYNSIFSVTFDENFSNATGIKSSVFNSLIAVLTALTVVIGMRLMGAMMISSLIIFPSLSAMRIFKSYKSVTLCAIFTSIICFFIGIVLSFILSSPAGATIVVVNLVIFVIFALIEKIKCIF
jgi:zinc transport system permease protein